MKEANYYYDITNCIQKQVDKIIEKEYKDDECSPTFNVSILYKSDKDQSIIITCVHNLRSFSRVLFPREECYYGYDSLGDIIRDMYNQTM